jgi:hypothetical protein
MKKRVIDAETSDFHQELMHHVDEYIIFKPLETNRSTSSYLLVSYIIEVNLTTLLPSWHPAFTQVAF